MLHEVKGQYVTAIKILCMAFDRQSPTTVLLLENSNPTIEHLSVHLVMYITAAIAPGVSCDRALFLGYTTFWCSG